MKPYLFTLDDYYQYDTGRPIDKPVMLFDRGKMWLMIDIAGVMTIAAGYSWDGCSPKYLIAGRIWGTPDGKIDPVTKLPATYYASLVHDVLCQFEGHPDMPWSREEIDLIFYEVLQRDQFEYADLYYWGVVKLGPIHKRIERLRG